MLRGLRYALRPRVIFATQKKSEVHTVRSKYFEGVVCFQPNILTIDELEELFECFHMSIGVADLDTMMSDAMVTCISRVTAGDHEFGNWHALQNMFYRTEYVRRHTQTQEHEARQHLQRTTGMVLSTSNMLSLYYERQNMIIDVNAMHAQMNLVRRMIDDENDAVSSTLTVATDVAGPVGEQLRNSLMQSLDRNYAMMTQMHSLLSAVDRVTPEMPAPPVVVWSIMARPQFGPARPAAAGPAAGPAAVGMAAMRPVTAGPAAGPAVAGPAAVPTAGPAVLAVFRVDLT